MPRDADSEETIIVYRPDDLPPRLGQRLPRSAGPHRCLFWIAREKSGATEHLFATLPEPELDHVEAGMKLASLVAQLAARSHHLADLVRPDEVAPGAREYGGTYSLGFHTAPAADVEQHLRAAGHVLVPIADIFAHLAIVEVTGSEAPPSALVERCVRDEMLTLRLVETLSPGLFAIEMPSTPGRRWMLFDASSRSAERSPPRNGEVIAIRLEPAASTSRICEDLRVAARIVAEEHAEPFAFGGRVVSTLAEEISLELPHFRFEVGALRGDGRIDAALREFAGDELAAVSGDWLPLVSPHVAFDPERYRAFVRGVRAAIIALPVGPDRDDLCPADFLPIELLELDELATESQFESMAFQREAVASARSRRAADAFCRSHGLKVPDHAAFLDVAALLPDTVFSLRTVRHAETSPEALSAHPHGTEWLRAIVTAWVRRMLDDDAAASQHVQLFTEVMKLLERTLGRVAMRELHRATLAS